MTKYSIHENHQSANIHRFILLSSCRQVVAQMRAISYYDIVKEPAEILSPNVMTLRRSIDAGKLMVYKIGKEFHIEKAEFERFMNKAKTK